MSDTSTNTTIIIIIVVVIIILICCSCISSFGGGVGIYIRTKNNMITIKDDLRSNINGFWYSLKIERNPSEEMQVYSILYIELTDNKFMMNGERIPQREPIILPPNSITQTEIILPGNLKITYNKTNKTLSIPGGPDNKVLIVQKIQSKPITDATTKKFNGTWVSDSSMEDQITLLNDKVLNLSSQYQPYNYFMINILNSKTFEIVRGPDFKITYTLQDDNTIKTSFGSFPPRILKRKI